MKDQTWVAVDSVGAGMHDIVLAEEYFALNRDRYKAMSVVCHCRERVSDA
nr:Carbon dioxide concentrating mechanism protein CcmL [Raoultella sp. NCTC 9187]